MKAFLRAKLGTDNIENVKKEDVDRITKGEALIGRLKFRKGAGGLKKMELSKKQKYIK